MLAVCTGHKVKVFAVGTSFDTSVRERDPIALVWAGTRVRTDVLNLGDALSPMLVALCAGRPVIRVPARIGGSRMAAIGTIGHSLVGGRVAVWGTGCAPTIPGGAGLPRVPYRVPSGTDLRLHATRGKLSRMLMRSPSDPVDGVYGDPAWLLPRFHKTAVAKRWDLGVIVHPTELNEHAPGAPVRPVWARYALGPEWADRITIIDPLVTDAASAAAKIDAIRACRRIVSTSLHGLIIAEAYGIPCLYFALSGPAPGLTRLETDASGTLDTRIADFYSGLNYRSFPVFAQSRTLRTSWRAVMDAVDQAWTPAWLRADDLLDALPVPPDPVMVPDGQSGLNDPLVRNLVLHHDAEALRPAAPRINTARALAPLADWVAEHGRVPLSWVASTPVAPYANLGDALSALIVSAVSGLPVERRSFDDPSERLVGIGTIGHGQRRGAPHLWGTGLDGSRNAFDPSLGRFAVPPGTRFVVHATRGRNTAAILAEAGVAVQPAYGDPAWFLPRLFHDPVPVTHELGVVVHITELAAATAEALVSAEFVRYGIPDSLKPAIRIINTYTPPTRAGLEDKVREMRSCRRIAATSFHGVVIAEAYGIPCVWFSPYPGGGQVLDIDDPDALLDHRLRDFYSGTPRRALPVFGAQRHLDTPWDALMEWIDRAWSPLEITGAALLESFPLPRTVSIEDAAWPTDLPVLDSLPY